MSYALVYYYCVLLDGQVYSARLYAKSMWQVIPPKRFSRHNTVLELNPVQRKYSLLT